MSRTLNGTVTFHANDADEKKIKINYGQAQMREKLIQFYSNHHRITRCDINLNRTSFDEIIAVMLFTNNIIATKWNIKATFNCSKNAVDLLVRLFASAH
jgi:hypothetical protein